ncbi:hypothetical protein EW026_g5389 [Hermanssonia centrifuga]|uniref:DUF6535 domain-containing protein n=1 Tax=Hermanssonia centrifuga TaxID=98765 RepID=A0A4S4KFZ7_9APHY|nr:hypothetical protein EW026_g5389 [Hermanssonia centrifuga]
MDKWSDKLEEFANDVEKLLKSVREFVEFTDDTINAAGLSIVTDLRYRASCLKSYKGQHRSLEIKTYLHELSKEFGEHFKNIARCLSTFIHIGVPSIRHGQKRENKTLIHLSTVATFFSAVTATTLQYSVNQTATTLSRVVNGFWFSSLLLSSSAALNTWLILTWKEAH